MANLTKSSTGYVNTFVSVLASLFGVQSSANYQRDFSQGRFIHFIVIGVILFVLFVAGLLALAKWLVGA